MYRVFMLCYEIMVTNYHLVFNDFPLVLQKRVIFLTRWYYSLTQQRLQVDKRIMLMLLTMWMIMKLCPLIMEQVEKPWRIQLESLLGP